MVCVYFGHNNGVPKAHGLFNIFISYSNLFEKKNADMYICRFYFILIPRCLVPKRTSSFLKNTVKSRAVYFGIVSKLLR